MPGGPKYPIFRDVFCDHPALAANKLFSSGGRITPIAIKGDELFECLICGPISPEEVFKGEKVNRPGRLVHLVEKSGVTKVCADARRKT